MTTPTSAATAAGIASAREITGSTANAAFLQAVTRDFSELRETFLSGVTKSYEWRLSQLQAIEKMFLNEADAISAALAKDLGRPEYESLVADVAGTLSEAKEAIKNLKYWMRPETVATDTLNLPGTSRIERVPKGVALILAPWNFPINLAITPAIAAIAAGNCVVIKPSEVTPACEALIADLISKYLDSSGVRVILGGVPETTAILTLPWNHIFYTGNGMVAKIVMAAAAKHLTPVTLELGGKSPVIIDKGLSDAELRVACKRIMHTSGYMNAGQICVAPDYVLVHRNDESRVLKMLAAVTDEFTKASGPDNRRVVNGRHFDRLSGMLSDSNGKIIAGGLDNAEGQSSRLPATIVSRPSLTSPLMQEEVFGPLLSVLPVDSLDAAADFLRDREAPLALYIFTNDGKAADRVISKTLSGSVLVNDTLVHLGNLNLPFGGVGASGFGAYKGRWGFEEFSHKRSIMHKSLSFDLDRYPPYTPAKVAMIKKVQRGELIPSSVKKGAAAAAAVALGMMIKSRL